ncbi:MAG: AMP-binding protein [Acidobacteria bacterium]|nr:AMP-binding protein [Acidobacteriota bacterium]
MRENVADYLGEFRRLGNNQAYAERAGYRLSRSSYGEVSETSFRFARELASRGIGKGDRLLVWGPNSAAWVASFFGAASRGVVVVPMDDSASPDFAMRVFHEVKAKLLVCSRGHAGPGVPTIFFEDLAELVERHSPDPLEGARISPEEPLEIVFTSGTTAEPKGVVISHRNVLANVGPLENEIKPYLRYERLVHPVRFLNLLPLSHVFGQFLGMYLPPLVRGTVFFQETAKPAEVIHTIRQERISVLVAVPRMLESLREKLERDLESEGRLEAFRKQYAEAEGKPFLRRWWIFRRIHHRFGLKFWAFISGGATLGRETEEFWARLGFAVVQGYGLTETTSLVSVNHPFKVGRGSIGKVLAGRDVRLAPDGEILVRGGGVASAYWSAGKLGPVSSDEGWYPTGDIGELDAQGNLFFKGRKKDVIVTPAGMKVYPEDLESQLKSQPEVRDSVVVPFALNGNAEPCAVLLMKDSAADPARIIDRANLRLAEYQRIRRWVVWPGEDFPRTSTQKARRAEIARAVEEMAAPDGRMDAKASRSLRELIARITKRSPEGLEVGADLDRDLNLSSLDRVELLSAIEDRYQIDVSETRFSAVKTVGDLEKMLAGEAPPRVVYHYPAWAQRWPVTWVRFAVHYLLLRPAVVVLGWPRIEGRKHLRGVKGPVLVVSNHVGDVDVGFVQTALPFRLRHKLATATGGEALEALRTPPAARNFFKRTWDRIMWFLGVSLLNLFPLPREAGFRASFAFAGESIDRGYSVLLFPEGHHTTDGKMRPFRSGIGLLVNSLRIPVVPMRLDGLFELKQAGKTMARPYKIQVRIGHPITFAPDKDPDEISSELKSAIEAL